MSSFFFSAAVSLVLWAGAFLYLRFYVSRRTNAKRILSEFSEEVGKLVSDIDATTDRDLQLVEDRMKALRALLDETDKRVATMRREIDRRVSEERAYSELGRRSRTMPLFAEAETPLVSRADSAEQARPRPAVQASSPAAASNGSVAPLPGAGSSLPPPSAGEATEARFIRAQLQVAPKEQPFAEKVAELHRAGFSPELIANRLGKTVGEVDLAIALSSKLEERDVGDTGH
jgi:hypothetical protein